MASLLARSGTFATAALICAQLLGASPAAAAVDCSSQNPADWPPPSKPYFMIAFDTSGSMNDGVSPAPTSCAGYPATKLGHARCALSNMIKAYAGEVNLGLATFPRRIAKSGAANGPTTCPGNVGTGVTNCTITNLFADDCGAAGTGTNAQAANILVGLQQDDYWNTPPTSASNAAELLTWVDNSCTDCKELFSAGYTPLNGILRDMYRYLSNQWSAPGGTPTFVTPLTGTERACRVMNVILMTDGQEFCDPNRFSANNGAVQAGNAAAALLAGWTIGATSWSARTFVIAIGGDAQVITDTNNIASRGGTTAAYSATNEQQLSTALASIIAGAVNPESCDNVDNNCNGCIDEGFKKFCNRNKTGRSVAYLQTAGNAPGADDCCNAARATCLTNFASSISAAKPQGDRFWLPCWDPAADNVNPESKWVCTDPGESCDDADNNCEVSITPAQLATNVQDEGFNKCPSCPVPETCDGKDQNCDGIIDNAAGSTTSYSVTAQCRPCIPSPEGCDGCDNDCDGDVDEGIAPVTCGFSPPAACLGTRTCTAHTAPGGYLQSLGLSPGSCLVPAGGVYSACSDTPGTETCNGVDDDCDGIVDNNPTGEGGNCTPNPGDPTAGACAPGKLTCQNGALVCLGYIGPTQEICDNIDNDCDGLRDAADPDLQGDGKTCGSTVGRCTKGVTACVAGVLVCTGGNQSQPEVCNGLDDDCNNAPDDGVLDDAPTSTGCWTDPVAGTCALNCSHAGATWCPPQGATCTGVGSLQGTCRVGTLFCRGVDGWKCQGSQGPRTEDCNLADDDCDGETDEVADLGPPIGEACGKTVPNAPCLAGIWKCDNGSRVCDGEVPAEPEICNGRDDDCDGTIDNGIAVGGPCWIDPVRQKGVCTPGVLRCDSSGGQECFGGVGPTPEICDGLDNDCDGDTDESGAAPEGVDGTADPLDTAVPPRHLGDACGSSVGICKPGTLGCLNGRVECQGGVGKGPELCDCLDNDCDGTVDEDAAPSEDALCSTGKTCAELVAGVCKCVEPCKNTEFPCPGGQTCNTDATHSGTDVLVSGGVCAPADTCGDCSRKAVKKADGTIECAPAGSQPGASRPIPVCVCKGQAGCHDPCSGFPPCPAGQACSPLTVSCQDDTNCFFFGCPPGEICSSNRVCAVSPCSPNPCAATEVCKPTGDFLDHRCVGSCAGKSCAPGEECVEGECSPTGCGVDCTAGQVCLAAVGDAGAAVCGPSRCPAERCRGGEFCDARSGQCGADPCAGVACPAGQACAAGECQIPPASVPDAGAVGGGSGLGGAGGRDSGAGNAGGNAPVGGRGPGVSPNGAFGLATGGGGCACSVPGAGDLPVRHGIWAGLAAAALLGARRRTRPVVRKGGVR